MTQTTSTSSNETTKSNILKGLNLKDFELSSRRAQYYLETYERIIKVFLDEDILHCDRDQQIMRILQWHHEEEMTEKRQISGASIPAQFLRSDGTVKEAEWREHRNERQNKKQKN